MENQKRKGSAGTIALVVLLLIVAIVSIILATYAWAKYTTTKTGKAEVAVAKWDVNFSGTQTNHSFQHVVADRLAPGTSGEFAMTITSPNTETAYSYVIAVKNLVNNPTNLKWYTTRTLNSTTGKYEFSGEITNLNSFFSGTVTLDPTTHKATVGIPSATIYWYWPYETTTTVTTVPADSPASAANMKQAMVDLANAVRVNNGEEAVEASTFATAQAALDDALASTNGRTPATATQVNDAIDTAEGMTAPKMEFDADFTATQLQPVANNN